MATATSERFEAVLIIFNAGFRTVPQNTTATRYGMGGPGIEYRWGRDFLHSNRPTLGLTQPPVQGYWVSFPAVQRPGRGVEHQTPVSAKVKEGVQLYS
jgi:hypothetical protein